MKFRLIVAAVTITALAVGCARRPAIENLGAECPEWKASWIGASWIPDEWNKEEYKAKRKEVFAGEKDTTMAAPEFRKEFALDKRVKKATAYICGLGFGELWLNSQRVSTDQLSPNETNYTYRSNITSGRGITIDGDALAAYRVLYMSYDVTSLLRRGSNEARLMLGNGFFHTESAGWVATYGAPRIICQIDVEYTDGSAESIVTDETWQVRRSSILLNDMYDGEIYDATYSGIWEQATPMSAPTGELCPQTSPVDKVMEVLAPKSIEKLEDGSYRVDFGDYITGWTALKGFKAPAGTTIDIVHECETRGNGVWRYISDGSKADYAPRFTWWAFRYVVIKGWPGELKSGDIEARAVYANLEKTGNFECSNPLINRIMHIWWRSETDNMHLGVASDCPHREKGPYTGDGEVSCTMVLHTFGAQEFYRKWIRDMRDVQDVNTGYVPNGAPWHPGCGGGVPWGSAMCVMPWECYVHYGDISFLEDNYEAMKAYLKYLSGWRQEDGTCFQKKTNMDGKWQYWLNLGEWCAPFENTPDALVHTWSLWKCATYTANAAAALGKAGEEAAFRELAQSVWEAFHAVFYNPETHDYSAGGTPTNQGESPVEVVGNGANFFALNMGVPEDRLEDVLATVKEELKQNNGHLNTGIYGTLLFFDELCKYGMGEAAYEAVTKTDYPSFGWWIEQGADTTWEQWNGKNSRNHPMFGGGLVWLCTRVAGLQTDPAEPGYKHIIVKPTPLGDLEWASYSTKTPYGEASVKWERKDGKFLMSLAVPDGCHASVYMPGSEEAVEVGAGKFNF